VAAVQCCRGWLIFLTCLGPALEEYSLVFQDLTI